MSNRNVISVKITDESISRKINRKNRELQKGFSEYLLRNNRTSRTINGYTNDIEIFFTWNYKHNDNINFTRLTTKQLSMFQEYAVKELKWNPNRIIRVKSVLKSLSTYIETELADEYPKFISIIGKIPNPKMKKVLEKTEITEAELDAVLESLLYKNMYQAACALSLAANSSCSVEEMLQFKADWFDDKNIVPGTCLYATPEKIRMKGKGKEGMSVTAYILTDFKKYYDLWMEERENKGIKSEYLFVNKKGKQAEMYNLSVYSRAVTRRIGKPFYFSCLEELFYKRLVDRKVPGYITHEFFRIDPEKYGGAKNDYPLDELTKYFKV